ncbi:hypothetical protein CFC21_038521 [Triticum aestivum]|uniref:Disease resistance R13L4/SHOC-2-like LRR domain-containing protein n=2 Tax=Triticum aestivum TaxID=4565 RepID=A0A3B6ETG7_WHEAT|nr:hypothetical protein CFC21_038521 [Triticum aestivum]
MRLLRVLDLEGEWDLVDHHLQHIGKLVHLRYLSVRGHVGIHHLPNSLGNLRQLQTLDISGTTITKLPRAIIKLVKMQGILASGRQWTSDGVEMPSGIWKLKALHTLRVVDVSVAKTVLQDIKMLTRLRKLGVTGISKRNSQELCSAIALLSSLESLSLCSEGETGLSGCLDGLSSPPENLQSLKLIGNLVELPEWIQGLKNLVKLKLEGSGISEVDATMQVLGNLPNLATLRLLDYSFVGEEVSFSFCRESFPRLKVLQLHMIENIKSVGFEEGAAPKLELLQYWGRYDTPTAGLFRGLAYLPSLKEFMLHERNWRNTELVEDLRGQLAENQNGPVLKSWKWLAVFNSLFVYLNIHVCTYVLLSPSLLCM